MTSPAADDFEKAASQAPASFLGEFWTFLKQNKKWWLLPILIVLLVCGLLIFATATGAAPFIYTLF